MDQMALSATWWTAILTSLSMGAFANDSRFRNDSRLNQVPWVFKKVFWEPNINRARDNGSFDNRFIPSELYQQAARDFREAHKRGVKLLLGTDNTDAYVFAGSSLLDEMSMFSSAAVDAASVLKIATYHSAVYAGLEHDLGSVGEGKIAELVLLNATPLDDIENVRDIESVFLNGGYLNKGDLNKLEQSSVAHASSVQLTIAVLWDILSSPLWRVQLMD